MTKSELIKYYSARLEKVKALCANDWRKAEYIKQAEEDLKAVKNGRKW